METKKIAKNSGKPSKRKPSVRRQRLVEELSKPDATSIAEAGRKAGFSPTTIRATIYNVVADPQISEAIEKRRARALAHHSVTPEEVLGSAAFQMRSSMDDVLDEEGSFDIAKARETGAVDLLKKHKETIKTSHDKDGGYEVTKTIEVELLTNESGRKEVANYIGLEKFAPQKGDSTPTEKAIDVARRTYQRLPDMPLGEIFGGAMTLYPEAERDKVEEFVRGLGEKSV